MAKQTPINDQQTVLDPQKSGPILQQQQVVQRVLQQKSGRECLNEAPTNGSAPTIVQKSNPQIDSAQLPTQPVPTPSIPVTGQKSLRVAKQAVTPIVSGPQPTSTQTTPGTELPAEFNRSLRTYKVPLDPGATGPVSGPDPVPPPQAPQIVLPSPVQLPAPTTLPSPVLSPVASPAGVKGAPLRSARPMAPNALKGVRPVPGPPGTRPPIMDPVLAARLRAALAAAAAAKMQQPADPTAAPLPGPNQNSAESPESTPQQPQLAPQLQPYPQPGAMGPRPPLGKFKQFKQPMFPPGADLSKSVKRPPFPKLISDPKQASSDPGTIVIEAPVNSTPANSAPVNSIEITFTTTNAPGKGPGDKAIPDAIIKHVADQVVSALITKSLTMGKGKLVEDIANMDQPATAEKQQILSPTPTVSTAPVPSPKPMKMASKMMMKKGPMKGPAPVMSTLMSKKQLLQKQQQEPQFTAMKGKDFGIKHPDHSGSLPDIATFAAGEASKVNVIVTKKRVEVAEKTIIVDEKHEKRIREYLEQDGTRVVECTTLIRILPKDSDAGANLLQVDPNFYHQFVDYTNELRAKHQAPPLQMYKDLNRYATEWAQHLAKINKCVHRDQQKYGENLYYKYEYSKITLNGYEPVQSWYDEIEEYYPYFGKDPPKSIFQKIGHFTNLVWKSSKRLGVGYAKGSNTVFVVCYYDPPGNLFTAFATNVLPALPTSEKFYNVSNEKNKGA